MDFNKKYSVKEAVSYYIYVCNEMNIENEEITLRNVLENLVLTMKNISKEEILRNINKNELRKIRFSWIFSSNEVIAYAIAIFYVLINRKERLSERNIIHTMLSELYMHKPSKTLKESEFIAEKIFPELKESKK